MGRRNYCFFFQAEDGIRDLTVTGVQTCALPILSFRLKARLCRAGMPAAESIFSEVNPSPALSALRSEEHTSELQSQSNLVCRLLLEKNNSKEFRQLLSAMQPDHHLEDRRRNHGH